MNSRNLLFWIFILSYLSVGSVAFAEKKAAARPRKPASKAPAQTMKIYWNWFQLGGGAMFDSDGGSSGIAGLNWNPTLRLDSTWRLKLSLGTSVGNLGTGQNFFIGEGLLSLVYLTPSPFWFEAGGGISVLGWPTRLSPSNARGYWLSLMG